MDPVDVHAIFDVDADAGRLWWRVPPKQHPRLAGVEAGGMRRTHSGKCYCIVRVGGKSYRRGQLIYRAVHGCWAEPCLDHISGDSTNDSIHNLRAATITENARNHKRRKRRIPLPMGVRNVASGRFQARISVNKRQIHLGCYDTPEQAQAVYIAKRKEYFGAFA